MVLSGIDLGNYRRDLNPRTGLGVIRRILDETPIERLRVSFDRADGRHGRFVGLFAASDRLARHFHMPMQSGSDRILAAMHPMRIAPSTTPGARSWFANGSPTRRLARM